MRRQTPLPQPVAQPAEGADARPDPERGRRDPAPRQRVRGDHRGGRARRPTSPSARSTATSRPARTCSTPRGGARCAPSSAGRPQQVETLDQILELTRAAYENFDANEGIVRAIISAPEGVEVRKRPAEIRLDMLKKAYAGLLAGVPEDQVKAVLMATHALSSASVWSHLRDYCGARRRGGRQDRRPGDRADRRGHQGPRQGRLSRSAAIRKPAGRRGSRPVRSRIRDFLSRFRLLDSHYALMSVYMTSSEYRLS